MTSGTKGLVVYKDKLLLILRDNRPDIDFPNTWEYIGGAKDGSETFEEAGLREIEEEIGIRPRYYRFLGFDYYPGRQAGRFVAILSNEEYKNIQFGKEGQKYDFFTLEETLNLDMAQGLKKFLLDNQKEIKNILKGSRIKTDKFIFTKE